MPVKKRRNPDIERKNIPIIDCPNCGAKDVPLSFVAQMQKGEKVIEIWECSQCRTVPNLDADLQVKRWITERDLIEMGFKQ